MMKQLWGSVAGFVKSWIQITQLDSGGASPTARTQSQRSTRLELEHLEDRRLMSATPGLTAQYFTGQTLQTLKTTRTDSNVNFTWNNVSPAAGVASTNFSVRWTGQIYISQSGLYSFSTRSDDGIKVIINGQTLINDWTAHSAKTDTASTFLTGGKSYSIEVDYYQATGGAVAELSWTPPGKTSQIIPESVLSTAAPVSAPVSPAPTSALSAAKVTTAGGTSSSFTVTYNDTVTLNAATIGTGDVVVTGPNGYKQTAVLTGVTHSANDESYTATYKITPPGGTWDASDDGAYTVTLQASQVEDSRGVWEAGRALGSFQVAVLGSPTAALSAPRVTAAGATSDSFTVTYNDTVTLNAATIGTGDVVVTGPNGFKQTAVLTGVTHSANDESYTATYRITPPGGKWDAADNGTYTVTLESSQVEDSTGVWEAGRSLGSFQVAVLGSPTAALSAAKVTAAGATSDSFTVTYNDTVTLNAATIGTGDVVVTGPNGFKQTAVLTGVTHSANDESYTATYRITPPGGKWDTADDGTYTVTLQAYQVEDSTGVWEAGRSLGTFQVAVVGSPTAGLSAAKVTAAGATSDSFTVTYNDTVTLNAATIGTGDVIVTGPNGFKQTAVLTGLTHSTNDESYTGTYRITPPGGKWDAADNGVYTVTLQATQVEDSTGVWAAGRSLGSFVVAVPGSPTASLSVGNVTVPGGKSSTFTVTYTDVVAFNSATIGTGDVVVTGPKGFKQTAVLTGLTHTPNGESYTATYKITPPGGTWDSSDNGAYTVTLQATQVEDFTGVWESSRSLGSFQVLLQGSDWFSDNFQNANLQVLARQLLTDGNLSRNDAIQLLDSAEASGNTLSASELQDLRTLFDGSGHPYSIADYVKNLADKVIDGNAGNAVYNGRTLGNLAAGSASWVLGDLVGEWFLGTDLPTTDSGLSYTNAGGSLFGSGPSYTQIVQGGVGDCYFLAALGETAMRSPADIENMFIDNGDGTYTIRFYNNGQADYVTVNREVPTESNGYYAYANMGEQVSSSSNVIWVPLLEKAYAQLASSGWSRGTAANAYSAIDLGWEGDVLSQIDKDPTTYNSLSSSSQKAIGAAFDAGDLVALDTKNSTATGIVANHVYIVVGYNASNGAFTLYNPWGATQTLTWAQIDSNFDAWSNGNRI